MDPRPPSMIAKAGLDAGFRDFFANRGVQQVLAMFMHIRTTETTYEKRQRNSSRWRSVLGFSEAEIMDLDNIIYYDSNFINSIADHNDIPESIRLRLSSKGNRMKMIGYLVAICYDSYLNGLTMQQSLNNYRTKTSKLTHTRESDSGIYKNLYINCIHKITDLERELASVNSRLALQSSHSLKAIQREKAVHRKKARRKQNPYSLEDVF